MIEPGYGIGMTSATRSVAVVATRLPTTDRRALSQAWYSALHISAAPAKMPHGAKAAGGATSPLTSRTARVSAPSAQTRIAERPANVRASVQRTAVAGAGPERRVPVSELARRIQRALQTHVIHAPSVPVTLAIAAADGRVALFVRNDGGTTRVVAICAPPLRERVDRALAQARFALAARGSRVEVVAG